MTTHGGARKGSGRRKLDAASKRRAIAFMFSPETIASLQRISKKSRFVEQAVLAALKNV